MQLTNSPSPSNNTIDWRNVGDKNSIERCLPLSSTIVHKRKEETLYMALNFSNDLRIDALVDSGAYDNANAATEMNKIKQQAPPKT